MCAYIEIALVILLPPIYNNFFDAFFVSESVGVSSNTEASNIIFSLKQINENIISLLVGTVLCMVVA